MSNSLTLVGNLTRDPELRFSQAGQAICSFAVASNRRFRKGEDWEERVSFFDCTAFGQLGENIASSLSKGDRVMVAGYMEQRSYETSDGDKRTVFGLTANEVGAELRFATVAVERVARSEGQRTQQHDVPDPGEPF